MSGPDAARKRGRRPFAIALKAELDRLNVRPAAVATVLSELDTDVVPAETVRRWVRDEQAPQTEGRVRLLERALARLAAEKGLEPAPDGSLRRAWCSPKANERRARATRPLAGPDDATASPREVAERLARIGVHTDATRVAEVATILFLADDARSSRPVRRPISDRQFEILARAFLLHHNFHYEFEELAQFIQGRISYDEILHRLKAGLQLVERVVPEPVDRADPGRVAP